MSYGSSHLSGFTQLAVASTDEERRSLWRQSMATLARAAVEQRPVPLEGIDPKVLLEAVRAAIAHNLIEDLSWLSPPAAAAAVYELASAIPIGPERRQLGRQVLTRLYEGDAETFVVLASSLAAESKRTLTGVPTRARVALALDLPLGSQISSDRLALTLLSRADLRREWLSDPAGGSLPSRRQAARLLERAARETARLVAQGDSGSLRAFQEPAVQAAWKLLLADRESLVWRHVAVARGILARADQELSEEIEQHLDPKLTPTEWRRAAVSLAASIGTDPVRALKRCREVLANDALKSDSGLPGTMIYGLAQAAETEPEAAEELLNQIVRVGGFEGAEALIELRRERPGSELGLWSAAYAREKLQHWLTTSRVQDDGRVALCEVLIDELSSQEDRRPTLRELLDAALQAFAEKDARAAHVLAQQTLLRAIERMTELEQARDEERAGRRLGFRAMRELDVALLETAALGELLALGATGKNAQSVTAPLGDLYQRLSVWLVRAEARAVRKDEPIEHITLRLRRLRTLLHLVDADGSYGEDVTNQRRERRITVARVLLARARDDAPSPLRRIVCAALARALDALVRDDICELSDALVALADNVPGHLDQRTVAEASMLIDFQRSASAYADLTRATEGPQVGGRRARAALDALVDLAQSLPWSSTLRVSALRQGLLEYARDLEAVAAARSIAELAAQEPTPLSRLESTTFSLAQLAAGARRRLVSRQHRPVPASGSALSMLEVAVEQSAKGHTVDLAQVLASVTTTLGQELPEAIANAASIVLGRLPVLPSLQSNTLHHTSFVPPAPREAPLPPWLPGRRIIGGFYVQRALGAGGVGSVFVVTRAEERHRDDAVRFALKVPDYSAEAARTLSEEEFLKLFREEAGALLAMPRQRNLATFVTFDAGARPKPILVMELVEGPTLERSIERGDLSVPHALELLDGIASGLSSMHRVGIGHLDVKPSNIIMRTPRLGGDRTVPVLVDFGLAGRNIRPGCATGPYGAPEIWGLGPEGVVLRPSPADVYAFSCLAYEALAGDTLFDGPSELAVINAHLTHDGYPAKLLALRQNPRLAAVCDLIANGLRQNPEERIGIDEMREGFRELGPGLAQMSWPVSVEVAA